MQDISVEQVRKILRGHIEWALSHGKERTQEEFFHTLAVISWLGYDAPDSVFIDAPFNNYANVAGPALRDFVYALPTEGKDVHPVDRLS